MAEGVKGEMALQLSTTTVQCEHDERHTVRGGWNLRRNLRLHLKRCKNATQAERDHYARTGHWAPRASR